MTMSFGNEGVPGLVTTDHWFQVPLDYSNPDGEHIEVFAREVVDRQRQDERLPYLVFFQGGPGFGSPRPTGKSGWLKRALKEYRVILLDQRGTGRSTPVCEPTLAKRGDVDAQVEYLRNFRADSIVHDAERIRHHFCGDETWTALGQSYGGWCISSYLSFHPEGLAAALFTGGLPPIQQTADDVYRVTYPLVEKKINRFYERYPEDEALVKQIVDYLNDNEVRLPQGDILSVRRFQQIGLAFYRSTSYEDVHYLLENAFVDGPDGPTLHYRFLRELEATTPFEAHPIFALLHEAIYAEHRATNWAAHRIRGDYPQFDDHSSRILLTGEMIYPWMFDEYEKLKPYKELAEKLAAIDDWGDVYNVEQLQENEVPTAAIVYYEDMCVARQFSEQTAKLTNGTKIWVTNEYEHDGLRIDGERILSRLIDMVRGETGFAH
jgi:pimeloyl-ACP methyl ester carboxylesterase